MAARYGIALAFAAAGLAAAALLTPVAGPAVYTPLVVAVALTVWFTGTGPGLLVAAVCTASASVVLVEPRWEVSVEDGGDAVRLASFVAASLAVVGLGWAMRRAGASAAESAAVLDSVFDGSPVGLAYLDRGLRFVRVNAALAAMNGRGVEEHLGRRLTEVLPDFPEDLLAVFHRVLGTGEPVIGLEASGGRRSAPGRTFHFIASWHPVRGADGSVVGIGVSVVDVTERREGELREQLVAEVATRLDATVGLPERLDVLARLLVPRVADGCVVDVVEDGGRLRRAAAFHVDPDAGELIRGLPPPRPGSPGDRVMRDGRPLLIEEVGDEHDARTAHDEDLARRRLRLRSAVVVPLRARGETIGLLSAVTSEESGRRYGPGELTLVRQVADRAALAIDNARLYERQRSIASELQRGLLPAALPRIPGCEVAARHVAAGEGLVVGGDFFDVFEAAGEWSTAPGAWALAIGDVCGKGPEAAGLTALVRYTLRAEAVHGRSPDTVLRRVNRAMLLARDDLRFCTAIHGTMLVTAAGARVALACAGHPAPLVLRAAGGVEEVAMSGHPLGLYPDAQFGAATATLGPGDALVLLTDGVLEAFGADTAEEPALGALLSRLAGRPAAEVVEELVGAAIRRPRRRDDDVTVCVVRVAGPEGA